jgi:ABC-type glycerol-3-phosphate transport system permease component
MAHLLVRGAAPDAARHRGAESVLIFTFIWNDYFWAIVLTQGPNAQPVTAGITSFNSQFVAQYHLMSAGRSWPRSRRC